MKFTHFKHILALPTYGLTCPGFEWWALKKWKMEPGHPVYGTSTKLRFVWQHVFFLNMTVKNLNMLKLHDFIAKEMLS